MSHATKDLATFLRWVRDAGYDPADMDYRMFREYTVHLITEAPEVRIQPAPLGLARRSAVRKQTAVRELYRFLVQVGWFKATPVPSARAYPMKLDRPLPSFLSNDEVERLLEACPGRDALETRDRSILEVLYATGVRLDELARMDVGDVGLLANAAVVVGKGNRERMVHFGAKAADWLTDYVRNRRPELAAGPDRGGSALWLNYRGGRLSRTSINSVVKRWAAAAGLATSGVHPHSLRHTFATGMVEGGADLRLVQELLGHAKVTSTQVYTHITQKEARRSYLQHHPLAKHSRGTKLWVQDIEALLGSADKSRSFSKTRPLRRQRPCKEQPWLLRTEELY